MAIDRVSGVWLQHRLSRYNREVLTRCDGCRGESVASAYLKERAAKVSMEGYSMEEKTE